MLKLNKFYSILLLLFVVLGVYYPAIFAGALTVDDQRIIYSVDRTDNLDFLGIFSFGQKVFYYRPLTMLSFHMDKALWDLSPDFMHLENVLLHALNALLIMLLAQRIFNLDRLRPSSQAAPLFCALLFALHPINSESVNWISGRTDILASTFMISSVLFLVAALQEGRFYKTAISAVLFVLAVISKEVALFLFPAVLFLIWRWPVLNKGALSKGWHAALFSLPFLSGFIYYAIIRLSRYESGGLAVTRILESYPYDFINTVRVSLKVFGFYVKKLFAPLPLNFVILEVNDFYAWFGLLILLILAWGVWKWRSIYGLMFLVSCYMIVPAILIALMSVAWTPVAERYLYFSSIFFVIAFVGFARGVLTSTSWFGSKKQLVASMAVILLLGTTSVVTAERAIIWQDSQSLYEDTLAKSPDSLAMHNELAIIYRQQNKLEEAEKLLVKAQEKASGVEVETSLLYINQALNLAEEDRLKEAHDVLTGYCPDKIGCDIEVLKSLARIEERIRSELAVEGDAERWTRSLIGVYDSIYKENGDSFMLYRKGQLLIEVNERSRAAETFAAVAVAAPDSAYYKAPAIKLSKTLKAE